MILQKKILLCSVAAAALTAPAAQTSVAAPWERSFVVATYEYAFRYGGRTGHFDTVIDVLAVFVLHQLTVCTNLVEVKLGMIGLGDKLIGHARQNDRFGLVVHCE